MRPAPPGGRRHLSGHKKWRPRAPIYEHPQRYLPAGASQSEPRRKPMEEASAAPMAARRPTAGGRLHGLARPPQQTEGPARPGGSRRRHRHPDHRRRGWRPVPPGCGPSWRRSAHRRSTSTAYALSSSPSTSRWAAGATRITTARWPSERVRSFRISLLRYSTSAITSTHRTGLSPSAPRGRCGLTGHEPTAERTRYGRGRGRVCPR